MKRRKAVFWVGVAMMTAGVLGLLRIPAFYLNNYITGERLARDAAALINSGNGSSGNTASGAGVSKPTVGLHPLGSAGPPQNSTKAPFGQQSASVLVSTIPLANPAQHALIGLVVIPRLQLKAPVVQGTDDAVLNAAVGHLSDSEMPGQPGITVLAAHNATWFRHVDELQNGDTISVSLRSGTYEYAVTGHEIVHTGATLPNTAQSMLILESCYPLDALYLTPKRYLVFAKLVRIVPHANMETNSTGRNQGSTGASGGGETNGAADGMNLPSTFLTKLQVRAKVPSDMQAEGLLLHQNSLPLGTLRYENHAPLAFTQSSVPLQVTNTMVQLFEAYVHASTQKKDADLRTLFGSLSVSSVKTNPLYGVSLSDITFVNPLSLTLLMTSGDRLERVDADTTLRIHGNLFHLSLTADASTSPSATYPETLWLKLQSLSIGPLS